MAIKQLFIKKLGDLEDKQPNESQQCAPNAEKVKHILSGLTRV